MSGSQSQVDTLSRMINETPAPKGSAGAASTTRTQKRTTAAQERPDIPAGVGKHSMAALKKVMPAQQRILITHRNKETGEVEQVGRYSLMDIAPDGDLEGFILETIAPQWGRGVYPIFYYDANGGKKWFTNVVLAEKTGGNGGSTRHEDVSASRALQLAQQEREKAQKEERERQREIEDARERGRTQAREDREKLDREIAELTKEVRTGAKSPQDAIVTMQMIDAFRERGKDADSTVVTILREQIAELRDTIKQDREKGGQGSGQDPHSLYMMQNIANTLANAKPKKDKPAPAPPPVQQSSINESIEVVTSLIDKLMPGGIRAQAPQAGVTQEQIKSIVTDAVTTASKDMEMKIMQERHNHELKMKELEIKLANAQQGGGGLGNLDTMAEGFMKLRDVSGQLFGQGGEMGSMEFWANVMDRLPDTIESIGDAIERNAAAKSGSAGSPERKKEQQQRKQQKAEKNATRVIQRFATSLAQATSDEGIFNAIAFFVSKMHKHPKYKDVIRAIALSGGSDRRAYVEGMLEVFFGGEENIPSNLTDRVCKVIQDNEDMIRQYITVGG